MEKYNSGVYLIKNKNKGLIKIGCSNNINKRLKALKGNLTNLGFNDELELIDFILCKDIFKVENTLHRQFSDKRKAGEWFDLNENDLNSFYDICIRNFVDNRTELQYKILSKLHKNYDYNYNSVCIKDKHIPTIQEVGNLLDIDIETMKKELLGLHNNNDIFVEYFDLPFGRVVHIIFNLF